MPFTAGRCPRGQRGLKQPWRARCASSIPSLPAWAAWIETSKGKRKEWPEDSRCPRGQRGLKLSRDGDSWGLALVAARVGSVD